MHCILIVLLASFYVVAAEAAICRGVAGSVFRDAHLTFDIQKGKGSDPTQGVWCSRRYVPLVQPVVISPVLPADHFTIPSIQKYCHFHGIEYTQEYRTHFFSSLCNKAPPSGIGDS
jgi:hypothetical protein